MITQQYENLPGWSDGTSVLDVPAWVRLRLATDRHLQHSRVDDLELTQVKARDATLLTVCCRDAVGLDADALEEQTATIYRLMASTLCAARHRYPLRFWNWLPSIHEPMDALRDRYMVFNAGRFKAYCEWWGGREAIPSFVPTASGVGHAGRDLVVHCLAGARPGAAIENPRQVPSFGYSRRYGPLPPCFARATLIDPELLIGGTASIRGEQSMFPGDIESQLNETLANLSSVISAAARIASHAEAPLSDLDALAAVTSMRAYHTQPSRAGWIHTALHERFPELATIELVQAELCRAELLLEIEGVAHLPSRTESLIEEGTIAR
jgi:chorismate lyase/3-hydroxybenzoate synthase